MSQDETPQCPVCSDLADGRGVRRNDGAASPATASTYVSIPFADHGGIRDWRADGDRSMWIEGRNGQWYYAELFGRVSV
jgi:hypothetical protein